MSLHRSLKTEAGALNQHRSVLTRAERITRLLEESRFDPDADSPLGLVKVVNRNLGAKKKKSAKQEEGEATEESAETTDSGSA